MPKSIKRKSINRKSINRKSINRTKKTRRRRMKAGNPKHTCCMCGKSITDGLMPRTCYMKHGNNAHRICQDCWWDQNTGFANENATHECPGCLKGLQLTNQGKTKKTPIIIHEKGKEITLIDSDSD